MIDRADCLFVDGEWTRSNGSTCYTVLNPTTELPFGHFTVGSVGDIDRAVRVADRAMRAPTWRTTSLEDRIQLVLKVRDLLAERSEALAQLNAETVGAPYSIGLQLGGALSLIDMFVASARQLHLEFLREDPSGAFTLVKRRPVGVVAAILPWNTPIRSEVKKVVPAVLAGCAVVLKPSLEGTFAALAFAEVCQEAGFPPGLINVVPGDGATGEALVRHPTVRKIAFTGSTQTGARIATVAAPDFKRVQLELGGKSAAILLDDFDLAATIPSLVRGNWANSGQLCVALSRVLVPRPRVSEVVEALVGEAERQIVGDPLDSATTMGPLVSEAHRARVSKYVESGLHAGARLATGNPTVGDRGWFANPTVFDAVLPDMQIAREEIFGPVVSVMAYDSVDEAIEIANASPYGLHGAVFGADEESAFEVALRLDTGSAAVNGFYLAPSAPFGGVKQSGIGREHGPEGFDTLLEYVSYNVPRAFADRSFYGDTPKY